MLEHIASLKTFYEKPCEEKLIEGKEYNSMLRQVIVWEDTPPLTLQTMLFLHTNSLSTCGIW